MGQFVGKTIIEGGQGRTGKKYDLNNIVGRLLKPLPLLPAGTSFKFFILLPLVTCKFILLLLILISLNFSLLVLDHLMD